MRTTKKLFESIQSNLKEVEAYEYIDNPLLQKDFKNMLSLDNIDAIVDYLIEITMSCSKEEAADLLKLYYATALRCNYKNIMEAIKKLVDTSFN